MTLPNLSGAVVPFEQDIEFFNVAITVLDGQTTATPIDQATIRACVQVERPQDIQVEQVDENLKYIQVHARVQIEIYSFLTYKGITYKLTSSGNWSDYGYFRAIGEQVKGDLT